MEEKRYPIYKFIIWYVVEHPSKYHDYLSPHSGWHLHAAGERIKWEYMFREIPTREELFVYLMERWHINLASIPQSPNIPSLADQGAQMIGYEIAFIGNDTWAQGWFSHWTYNTHLSDERLLESFAAYVRAKRKADRNTGMLIYLSEEEQEGMDFYCLMGAQDRWRWKGPCRCYSCQERGITRIDH